MKTGIGKAVLAAAGIGALSAGACSIGLASFIMHGKRQTLEEARNWQDSHYETSWYDKLKKTDYEVTGYDGYILHVQLCENPQPCGKYVIITHGYTDNRIGMLKYMRLYLERGYHCIIYDLRGHGLNRRTFCTYGTLEGRDLFELIKDTRRRYPDLTFLGLHGESLGSAATVTALGYVRLMELQERNNSDEKKVNSPERKPASGCKTDGIVRRKNRASRCRVDFAVADCGFADIENVLKGVMKEQGRPQWLVDLASAGAKVWYGFALKDMRPIDWLYGNKVPVLFLHGAEDTFILPSNSKRMARATAGYQECHLIPGARHAESVLKQPRLYQDYLYAFLDKCENLG